MNHTYEEIHSQSASWRTTIKSTIEQWNAIAPSVPFTAETQFMLVGCGTSLHIARTAAQSFQETTQHVARAVASSEVFLSSVSIVTRDRPVVAFVISRSGETSEAVMAADHLVESFRNVLVVAVTCNEGTELTRRSHHSINLPHAAERSVVMTKSFTSMVLALQVIAALMAKDRGLLAELGGMADLLDRHMDRFDEFGRALGPNRRQDQFIYLGLGPNEGLAQEATLKLKEMTQTSSEAYNPLEFRHGPISIVREGTTVVILESLRDRAYMGDLESDLKGHGAYVAAIGPYPSVNGDVALELSGDVSDLARCVLYMPPLQLIAYHRAVAAGLDPDQPRNLSQVVVLADVERTEPSG